MLLIVKFKKINWCAVGISAASGALTGAITAACPAMGVLAVGAVHGTVGAASYAATEKFTYGRNPTLGGVLAAGITSGVLAGGSRAIGNYLSKLRISNLSKNISSWLGKNKRNRK